MAKVYVVMEDARPRAAALYREAANEWLQAGWPDEDGEDPGGYVAEVTLIDADGYDDAWVLYQTGAETDGPFECEEEEEE